MDGGHGILMHHIESTEHTSVVIVVAILILKKITVTTAAQEWTVIQMHNLTVFAAGLFAGGGMVFLAMTFTFCLFAREEKHEN
jgi:hypothetical protein